MSWLLKTIVGLAIAGVVLIDLGAVAVNALQLEEAADEAARAATHSWSVDHSPSAAQRAARDSIADQPDIVLQDLVIGSDRLTVTLTKPAHVLVAHRIGPLTRYVEQTVSKTSPLS
ncbi:MAG: hypothetical protein M3N52_10500 [Actinomycetota bacterium]|nr:hypothetical protein [Actinomycetota bacterium]